MASFERSHAGQCLSVVVIFKRQEKSKMQEEKNFIYFNLSLYLFNSVYYMCVCVKMRTPMCDRTPLEVKGQLSELDSRLISL